MADIIGWILLIVLGIIWGCKLGILGWMLGWWFDRDRCPHGFRTRNYCPTCRNFAKMREDK